MKTRLSLLFVLLCFQPLATASEDLKSNCPVTGKALIGSWERVSGGFFEEMSFEQTGEINIFNSWLHQRPEISRATWKIENCVVLISHPTQQEIKFALQVVGAQENQISLRDVGHKSEAVYKRVGQ